MRAAVIALAGLFLLSTTSLARCPCAHRPEGFEFLTSAKPIPPAHVRCMKFLDDYLKWWKSEEYLWKAGFQPFPGVSKADNERNRKLYEIGRGKYRENAGYFTRNDWGVPQLDDVLEMKEESEKHLPDYIDEEKELRAQLEQEIAAGKHGALIRRTRLMLHFNESGRRLNTAVIQYADCVIENGLPPTRP